MLTFRIEGHRIAQPSCRMSVPVRPFYNWRSCVCLVTQLISTSEAINAITYGLSGLWRLKITRVRCEKRRVFYFGTFTARACRIVHDEAAFAIVTQDEPQPPDSQALVSLSQATSLYNMCQ